MAFFWTAVQLAGTASTIALSSALLLQKDPAVSRKETCFDLLCCLLIDLDIHVNGCHVDTCIFECIVTVETFEDVCKSLRDGDRFLFPLLLDHIAHLPPLTSPHLTHH